MHRDDGKYLRQDFSGSSYSTSPRDTHSVDFICEIDIWDIYVSSRCIIQQHETFDTSNKNACEQFFAD